MAINLNDNVYINAGKPSEAKSLNSSNLPYANVAAALASIPVSVRYQTLTVAIGFPPVEYWFANGVSDVDLVIKQAIGGFASTAGYANNSGLLNGLTSSQIIAASGGNSNGTSGWATNSANAFLLNGLTSSQIIAASGGNSNGTSGWATNAANAFLLNNQNGSFYQNRSNHTGTQLVSTISDISTASVNYASTAGYALNAQFACIANQANYVNGGNAFSNDIVPIDCDCSLSSFNSTAGWANNSANAFLLNNQNGSFYQNRSNHTGTQTSSTISDFNSAVDARIPANSGTSGWAVQSNYAYTGPFIKSNGSTSLNGAVNIVGDGSAMNIYSAASGDYGILSLSSTSASLSFTDSGFSKGIQALQSVTGIQVFDAINSIGLYYSSDFSTTGIAAKGARWIVDKGYVDAAIAAGGGGSFSGTAGWATNAANAFLLNNQNGSFYQNRSNHTGTQLVSTISNISTASVNYASTAGYALNAAYTFTNGITNSSGTVRLGGTISQDTNIITGVNKIAIGDGNTSALTGSSNVGIVGSLALIPQGSPSGNRFIEFISQSGNSAILRYNNTGSSIDLALPPESGNRVIATRTYVDGITGGTAGFGAANGLTKNISTFELGGILNRNTSVTGSFNLELQPSALSVGSNNTNKLDFDSTGILVTLDTGDNFRYASNNHSNYTNRSIVDKEWVDNSTSGYALDTLRLGNQLPSFYLNRANEIGTQTVATISDLSTNGTSGYALNTGLLNNQNAAFYLNRTNHTGTQTSATISDFNTASNALFNFTNGLNKSSTNVGLGGTLQNNTVIAGGNNTISFGTQGNALTDFNINQSGKISINGVTGSIVVDSSSTLRGIFFDNTANSTSPRLSFLSSSSYLEVGNNTIGSRYFTSDNGYILHRAKYYSATSVLTDAANITVQLNASNTFEVTLTGDRTLDNPSSANMKNGGIYVFRIKQDGVGGRLLTWSSNYIFPGGVPPVLTVTANKTDIFTFSDNGTNLLLISSSLNL
jgi:hypothetical protein